MMICWHCGGRDYFPTTKIGGEDAWQCGICDMVWTRNSAKIPETCPYCQSSDNTYPIEDAEGDVWLCASCDKAFEPDPIEVTYG